MTTYSSTPQHLKTHWFERQKTLHSNQRNIPQRVPRNPSYSVLQGKARPGARAAVWGKGCRRPVASEAGPANPSEPRDQTASMAAALLPRRRLGATGLEISALGFGASPLGSVFQVRADDAHKHDDDDGQLMEQMMATADSVPSRRTVCHASQARDAWHKEPRL